MSQLPEPSSPDASPTSSETRPSVNAASSPVQPLVSWNDVRSWVGATRWLIAIALLSIFALTVVVILLYPRKYQSQAKLLLRLGRENMTLDPTAAATGQTMAMHQTRDQEIETSLSVMHNRVLLEDVIDALGESAILQGVLADAGTSSSSLSSSSSVVGQLKSTLGGIVGSIDPVTPREKAIRELGKQLSIDASRDSSVVEIHCQTKTPEMAQAIVQTWVDAYLSHHGDFHRTPGTLEFFQSEQVRLNEQLADAHQKLRQIKDTSGLVSLGGQQTMIETELAEQRSMLNQVEAELAASQSRAIQLRRELLAMDSRAVIEETSGSSESRDTMRARLFELEVLEQDLASRYTDEHPKLISTRRQLRETQDLLASQNDQRDEVKRGINPTFQAIETALALENATRDALAKKRSTLAERLEALGREVEQLNEWSETIAMRQRNVEVLEAQYLVHSERLEQARLEDVLQRQHITSVVVVQPASLQQRPTSPNKALCGLFGLMAMGLSAVGIPLWLGPSRIANQSGNLAKQISRFDAASDLEPTLNRPARSVRSAMRPHDHNESHNPIVEVS